MKMFFNIVILSLLLISCSPPSTDSTPTPSPTVVSYSSCEDIPTGSATTRNICPSSVGTWDNFLVEYDLSRSVLLNFDLWCGGSDLDHPSDQAGYDALVPAGELSSNDFKIDSDCASGSYVKTTGEQVFNIWRLAK